jgi:hypothetical protein
MFAEMVDSIICNRYVHKNTKYLLTPAEVSEFQLFLLYKLHLSQCLQIS